MKEIDARGFACPAPVLQTKAALEQENLDTVRVIVDNEAAKENVSRYLETQGFKTSVEQTGNGFVVIGNCDTDAMPKKEPVQEPEADLKKIMVMIATDRMGYGDNELGKKLLVNFIKTLKEMGPELWRIVFVNYGVKLTTEGNEVLPILTEYE